MRKLFKRISTAVFAFFLLASNNAYASSEDRSSGVPVFTETSATSYALMDGLTSETVVSKNADRSLPMASTTKIMTCIVALENAVLSDVVEIPKEAVGVEGSSVYLTRGEHLTLEELLFALMLESANDAAVAIALHVSADVPAFASLMNEKAADLKMNRTNFVNPHGLPAEGHYSTARDLCKLLSYAMKNEAFRVFSETKKMTISAPNDSKRYLSNHNKLLRMYDCCIGGKTGFTKEAGRCLVTAAEKNGRLLVCATLGDPNDWMDHVSLFEYGFSLYNEKQIVSSEGISAQVPVVGGDEKSVEIRNYEGFSYWLKRNEKFEYTIEAPRFLYADVREGETIGSVVYLLNGKEIKRLELIACQSVPRQNIRLSFWQRMLQIIRLWMD